MAMSLATPIRSGLRIKLYRKRRRSRDSVFISSTTRYTAKHSDPRVHAGEVQPGARSGWESFEPSSRRSSGTDGMVEGLGRNCTTNVPATARAEGDDRSRGRRAGARNPDHSDRVAQTAAKLILERSSRRTWSRTLTATVRSGVRRMRSGRWMNCCIRLHGRRRRRSVEILRHHPHSELMPCVVGGSSTAHAAFDQMG